MTGRQGGAAAGEPLPGHSTIAIPRNWMLLYRLRSQPRSIEREVLMQAVKLTVAVAFAAIAFAPAVLAQGTGIERMYILECGQGHTGDMSRWTPGQNVNVPMDIVDNCYLIK